MGVKGGRAKRAPSEEVLAVAALEGLAEEGLQCQQHCQYCACSTDRE